MLRFLECAGCDPTVKVALKPSERFMGVWHGIYTPILCEIGHTRLAWCTLPRLPSRSGVEGVAQKYRLKLQGYA